jgi:ubiquinone/menaquinone biosynthesis C-methylase UbiE/uncharacterized protein YbaR (Trm112 family)
MKTEESIKFNKSKIYETLDYQPEPSDYKCVVPWIVQQQIAATNGRHFIDRIGKLKDYPIYQLPLRKVTGQKLMLDIGSGWGRWLVAGFNNGYIPVGIDIRLEYCKTNRRVLADLNKQGYSIVADLENIPIIDNVFDLVWSFSVIQHTHVNRLKSCLFHINRLLNDNGFAYLEFPNKNGARNRFASRDLKEEANYDSWSVRYYSPQEYESIVNEYLTEFSFENHSFLGIGILQEDLRYVSLKNKIVCGASLLGSFFADRIPGLKNYSDSLYIKAVKKKNNPFTDSQSKIKDFIKIHGENPTDNLNVVPLLRCPLTSNSLILSEDKDKLINQREGFYYPVVDSIPILICEERQGI